MKKTVILLSFALVLPCYAENTSLGRTPDGRAWRMDSDGNKVIDYIADLEMNVDSLTREVQGLESELREKVDIIERMREGQICDTGIKERDLQDNSARYADTDYVFNGSQPDCSGEVTAAQGQLKAQCERNDALRRSEIVSLQQRLAQAQEDNRTISAGPSSEQKNSLSSVEEKKLRAELGAVNDEASRLNQEIEAAADRVAQLQDELSAKNSEYGLLRAQIAAAEKRTASFRESGEQERASLAPASLLKRKGSPQGADQGRVRAMDAMRGGVSTEFDEVKRIIASRDAMYREFRSRGAVVGFSPSAARTSDGRELGALQSQLERATSTGMIASVQDGLQEISKKMNEDLALMRRLSKVR